jgi:GTP cyclohydrolase I
MIVDKFGLKYLYTDDVINGIFEALARKVKRHKQLYLNHLSDEIRQLLLLYINYDYSKLDDILELFIEYLTNSEKSISAFINENIFEQNKDKLKELNRQLSKLLNIELQLNFTYELFVAYMKTLTHVSLMVTFRCMGVDLQNDSNVSIDYGSLGTPGRIAKMWTCKNIHDLSEPLSGRFALEPELVIFPAKDEDIGKPVTVTLTINAVCSHHLFRFGNEFRNPKSKAVISYIPKDKVLGLSKINRWVEWIARRGWLQEELTKYIGKQLEMRLETEDVYVGLINMQHGCVSFRGKNDTTSYTTTEYYNGKYTNIEFRRQVIESIM